MVKILCFTGSFPPPTTAGSVEYLCNIISHLEPGSVVVHTAKGEKSECKKFDRSFPQKVIRHNFIIHVRDSYCVSRLKRLVEYILWPIFGIILFILEQPDIIFIGEYNFSTIAAIVAKRIFKTPYVFYAYAEEMTCLTHRSLHNRLLRWFLKNASAIVAVSEYTRRLLIERGVDAKRIHKILPAIGHNKVMSLSSKELDVVRAKYGFNNQRVLLTVAHLVEKKGHATVIEALPIIHKSYPNTKYVLVGTGPQEQRLRDLARKNALEDHVLFMGEVSDKELSALYKISDIFVMPHRLVPSSMDTEGCPTVFLEASAHGKPVIGGCAGGVADAIIHGHTGYIIQGTDKGELAQTVIDLFDNPELIRRMGEEGRQYVRPLTPERNAESVRLINENLLKTY